MKKILCLLLAVLLLSCTFVACRKKKTTDEIPDYTQEQTPEPTADPATDKAILEAAGWSVTLLTDETFLRDMESADYLDAKENSLTTVLSAQNTAAQGETTASKIYIYYFKTDVQASFCFNKGMGLLNIYKLVGSKIVEGDTQNLITK